MAPLNLIPQKREFFEIYNRAAANIVEIADRLVPCCSTAIPRTRVTSSAMCETSSTKATASRTRLVDLVNRTFVTPFDRDDMYRLAGALDDICDYVDDAAGKVVSYGVGEIREPAKAQAQVIRRAAGKLAEAIGRLEGFKDSQRQIFELRELEDEGDRLVHDGVSSLFSDGADPLVVIKWKDIYEALEEAVDACDKGANVLEAIVVKNK